MRLFECPDCTHTLITQVEVWDGRHADCHKSASMFGTRGHVRFEYLRKCGCWIAEWDRVVNGKDFQFVLWYKEGPEDDILTRPSHAFVYDHSEHGKMRSYYFA